MKPLPNRMSPDDVRRVLFCDNREPRKSFCRQFREEIDEFAVEIAKASEYLAALPGKVPYDERSAWTDHYLFVAFSSLITSFHLLISGLQIPAGNLMRHFGEAIAMALLLSHRQIPTFDTFIKDPRRYSVQKAIELVRKSQYARLLGINKAGWDVLVKINSFYDKYSHASAFAGASLRVFSTESGRQIGGEFDTTKLDSYGQEVRLAVSAAKRLSETIVLTEQHLTNSKNTV